jgi:hypothetical protein
MSDQLRGEEPFFGETDGLSSEEEISCLSGTRIFITVFAEPAFVTNIHI